MQRLVFSFKNKRERLPRLNLRQFLRRYREVLFFSLFLAAGLVTGSLCSGNLKTDTLQKLDLLFTANLPQRLGGGALQAFCASFASGFLFLLAAFLLGFCVWGVVGLPCLAFFKGFGIGVSAGYLLCSYGFMGLVFYLTILLPGACVFSIALVYALCASFELSKRLVLSLFREGRQFRGAVKAYLRRSVRYLLSALAASVLDVLLWCAFAGVFNFK